MRSPRVPVQDQVHRQLRWLPVVLAVSFPIGAIVALANSGRDLPQLVAPEPAFSFSIPAAFTPEVQHWTFDILRWSVEYELPVELVATVMQIESCGHPTVHSSAGAAGLFQVMPFHFGAGEDPLEPETNAIRGLAYLARSLALAGGDTSLALAGYNGGHGQIGRAATYWPAETQRYVQWGSEILADVRAGTAPSPALQSWLSAGGSSLCRQAASALDLQ